MFNILHKTEREGAKGHSELSREVSEVQTLDLEQGGKLALSAQC